MQYIPAHTAIPISVFADAPVSSLVDRYVAAYVRDQNSGADDAKVGDDVFDRLESDLRLFLAHPELFIYQN